MKYRCVIRPEFAPFKYFDEKDNNGFNKFGLDEKRALYFTVIVPDFIDLDVSKIKVEDDIYFLKCKSVGLNTTKYSLYETIHNKDGYGFNEDLVNIAMKLVKNVINECNKYNVKLPTKNLFEGKLSRERWYPYYSKDPFHYFDVEI